MKGQDMGEQKRRQEAGHQQKPDEKIVFALSGDRSILILGIPEPAWDYMSHGKTHTFNLKKEGFPVNLVLFGAPTRAHILDGISMFTKGQTIKFDMQTDNSIPEDEKALPRMRKAARKWLKEKFDAADMVDDEELDELFDAILKQDLG